MILNLRPGTFYSKLYEGVGENSFLDLLMVVKTLEKGNLVQVLELTDHKKVEQQGSQISTYSMHFLTRYEEVK